MTRLKNHLTLAALLLFGCLFVLIPIAFAQDAPQQGQPRPGMQGMQPPPGGPGMGMRGPGAAMAGPGMGVRRPARGMMGPGKLRQEILTRLLHDAELQKQLDITEEQRKKLGEIAFNNQKANIQDRATLQVRRLELQHLMQADTPDRAAIEKKLQEVSQAQAALMRVHINGLLDFRAVLTKEQQDKIRDVVQKRTLSMRQQRMMPQPRMRQPGAGRPGGGNPPPEKKPGN